MTPIRLEIWRYLDEHASTYTPEALRRGLLDAGYEAAEVDAALREWEDDAAADKEDRHTLRARALWLHVAALGVVAIVLVAVILRNGPQALAAAANFIVTLALFLAVGWAISWRIGWRLLPRMGFPAVFIVPVISAVGLGGTCLAILVNTPGVSLQPRSSWPGVIDLRIESPVAFHGSAGARCRKPPEGTAYTYVEAEESLGSIDGKSVAVAISLPAGPNPTGHALMPDAGEIPPLFSIFVYPSSGSGRRYIYGSVGDVPLQLEASADRRAGTIVFEELGPESYGSDSGPIDPISGSVTWTCE